MQLISPYDYSCHKSVYRSVRDKPLMLIFTSAKEVMFLPEFVCLSVSLSKITQKVMEGSF